MKFGKKNLQLIVGADRAPSHTKRYKYLKSAVRRGVEAAVQEGKAVTIYDVETGLDLAVITVHTRAIDVNLPSPRIFRRKWAE